MSTIAVLTTNETGANSLTDINSNFSNLNTDKQEKGSGVTNNLVKFGASNILGDTGKVAPTGTIVGTTDSQTLTNKTLTAPSITTPTITKPVLSVTNPTAQLYTPTIGGTATLDLSLASQHYVTFPAGNITLAISNDTNNQTFIVALKQDSGGSRTVTWFGGISWAGGSPPTLTTTANKNDYFGFIRTAGSVYSGFIIGQSV